MKLERFETADMTVFWGCLLDRINATSKKLQIVEIDITVVIELSKVLIHFIGEIRNNFDEFENNAKELAISCEYERDFRRYKKRKLPGEKLDKEMQQTNGREVLELILFWSSLIRFK